MEQKLREAQTTSTVPVKTESKLQLMQNPSPFVSIHALENYTFGTKDRQFEKDASVKARFARMEAVRFVLHSRAESCV